MNSITRKFTRTAMISTTLLFAGCLTSPYPQYYPVASSPDHYSVTPYRPDAHAQNPSPCQIPNTDALMEWAKGVGTGESYHQRRADSQGNGRSTSCTWSESAGSSDGQPLPTYEYYYYDSPYTYRYDDSPYTYRYYQQYQYRYGY